MIINKLAIAVFSSLLVLNACVKDAATDESEISSTAVGAAIGAAVGVVAGNQVKGTPEEKRKAQMAAATLGAAAGAGIGNYMDRQEEKLRKRLRESGVSITRKGDEIFLNMPGKVTFEAQKSEIRPDFQKVLVNVADVLKEFDKADVKIAGHTDNRGNYEANQKLSENRANAVGTFLIAKGVKSKRISTLGYGPSQPVADNKTEEGRSQNRRVEITLTPKQ